MDAPTNAPIIVGLGEALFDVFPDEARLGGAPVNFAVHAHQLGNAGLVVSRVGRDDLGERFLQELRDRGMPAEAVQIDPQRPTGRVEVTFDQAGQPHYEIVTDVAWDALELTPTLRDLAGRCRAVCFGTLAQRSRISREAVQEFLKSAPLAERLFDVNLRPPFYDRDVIEASCRRASAVKLNREELAVMAGMFQLDGAGDRRAEALRRAFGLNWVALTKGADGMTVFDVEGECSAAGVPLQSEEGDPVGAGDATAAALLHGVVRDWDWPRTLKLATTLGAYVASHRGACPELGVDGVMG